MNKKYFIDKKVLAFLIGVEDEEEVTSAYSQYLSVLGNVIKKAIINYIQGQIADESIKSDLLNKVEAIFSGKLDNNSDNEIENMEVDKDLKEYLDKPEFKEKLDSFVDQFNKYVYDTYEKDLDESVKKDLNEYIKSVEDVRKSSIDTIKEIYEILLTVKKEEVIGTPLSPVLNLSSVSGQN